jgi:hypothetical protein
MKTIVKKEYGDRSAEITDDGKIILLWHQPNSDDVCLRKEFNGLQEAADDILNGEACTWDTGDLLGELIIGYCDGLKDMLLDRYGFSLIISFEG